MAFYVFISHISNTFNHLNALPDKYIDGKMNLSEDEQLDLIPSPRFFEDRRGFLRGSFIDLSFQTATESKKKNHRLDFHKTGLRIIGAMQLCHHHDRRVAENRKLGFRGNV